MLQNIANQEVSKVQRIYQHIDNSIAHVEHKLELRRNLNEKKEIAAKQFFQLTKEYIDTLERQFWENFEKEQKEEEKFEEDLNSQLDKMRQEETSVEPILQTMVENV